MYSLRSSSKAYKCILHFAFMGNDSLALPCIDYSKMRVGSGSFIIVGGAIKNENYKLISALNFYMIYLLSDEQMNIYDLHLCRFVEM